MNIAKRVVVKKHYFVTCLKGCFIFFTFAILIEQDCQSFSHHECTFTNINKSRYDVLIDALCIIFFVVIKQKNPWVIKLMHING